MGSMTVAVIALTVLAVVVVVVVLARQGSVGRLSEEWGSTSPRSTSDVDIAPTPDVVERPAGPGAEAMDRDPSARRDVPPGEGDERP
jgi:hypothetical protein